MKALTLWQPWASLIAVGAKKFETRSWATSYRGPIAIHAAKKEVHTIFNAGLIDDRVFWDAMKLLRATYGANVPYGCIVATAELVGCWHTYGRDELICCADLRGSRPGRINTFITEEEIRFGNYSFGRFAWELENVKMLDKPIPAKGRQGLWTWENA